jgi:hypothetical protein
MAQAKLTVPDAKFNFGFVPQRAKVSHVFWLYSTGVDTLKIDEIRPGCGCTKAPVDKKELAPGDSTRLEIIFSTQVYRNKLAKRPRILSNAIKKDFQVTIIANVLMFPDSAYPLVFKPHELDISQYGPDERRKIEFTATNVSDEDIKLDIIEAPDDLLKIKLPGKIKAGETETGTVEIRKEFLDQEFEKSITLELSDNQATRYTLPIKRSIRKISDGD